MKPLALSRSSFTRLGLPLAAVLALSACSDSEEDSNSDTGSDVTADAGADTTADAGGDTTPDASVDTTPDAEVGDDATAEVGGDADVTPGVGTIPEVAAAAGGFESLLAAATRAGLADDLSGEGPFTVFAPTDAAFAALLGDTPLADVPVDTLTDVLLYHVVAGEFYAADVLADADGMLETLLGDSLTFRVDGDDVYVNDAKIVQTDIEASNGVIHVIDAVLMPGPGTIPEVAAEAGAFNSLLAAVTRAGLADDLSSEGPFTVFAPTDDAFAALLGDTPLDDVPLDALTDILLYHVVSGELYAADVLADEDGMLETLLGDSLTFRVEGDDVFVNDAKIVQTDIAASNGVIHVIDAVLTPPELGTIPEVATDAGVFSTLLSALTAAELADDLMGEGPFTVFAPTDDAFAALGEGTLESLTTEQLTDILLYHVAAGNFPASAVTDGLELTMLNGDTATLNVVDGVVTIAGATVTMPDVAASNGVIHVIDAVILPPSE
ncbi:MAG: fasciclin domain-containing protein [Myxococcales bacterium]|nr:fasciclin domain-containing protein [Myxococcales bacterium]MCB9533983.1 fasciclin domain-containing protein [Myxococcales bacterium]